MYLSREEMVKICGRGVTSLGPVYFGDVRLG